MIKLDLKSKYLVLKIIYGVILALSDIIFIGLSCFLAYYSRFYTRFFTPSVQSYRLDKSYLFYSLIFLGLILFFSLILKLYNLRIIYRDPFYYLKIFIPPILSVAFVVLAGRLYENFAFSRLWILFLIVFNMFLLFFSRYIIGSLTKRVLRIFGFSNIDIIWVFNDNIKAVRSLSRLNQRIVYGIFLLISDVIFLALAFYLSYFLRFKTGELAEINRTYLVEQHYVFYSIIFIAISVLVFFLFNLYDRDKIYRGSGYYSRLIKTVFINIVIIMLAGYVFEQFTFSRKWLLLLIPFSIILILIGRFFIEFVSQKLMKKYGIIPRTIIIGIGENAKRIEDSLNKYSLEWNKIIGHVDSKKRLEEHKEYLKDFEVAGCLEELKDVIMKQNIQRIIISGPEFKYYEILEILENLKGLDVTVLIFPGFFEFSLRRISVREIGGVPLMQVSNIGFFGINLFLKNLIDYVLGTILFIFFIFIYLVVAVLIKLNSNGPVFFQQKRMTKDCKVFYMYKFRTMYIDAEERLKDLLQFSEVDGPIFKMKNDPRITRIGRFLRRFSIDELPQIINVLKGELSLVGPRPPLPSEVEKYDEWEAKRMNVKQGITGLWQISGRSDLSFEEMARLDLYYIQNWSIEMDLKIILKTIPVVLFGKGAY
ncbi:MAG: sugar transferase [Actinobacteria bacterium]|nr:sugar transferase [Actinomycetota bacterium]